MQIDNSLQHPTISDYSKVKAHGNDANLGNDKNQTNLQTSDINNKNEKIENSLIDSSYIFSDKKDLSIAEQVKKLIIENIFSKFAGEGNSISLFPSDDFTNFNVSQTTANPYEQSVKQSPFGFVYESTQEYYQKTTIDFSTSATINTPNGQYNIELNLSYTHEYYERNSTKIAFMNQPMNFDFDKDDDSLKDLKKLDLVFDVNNEQDKNKTLFDYIREMLIQRQKMLEKQNDNNDFGHNRALSNNLLDDFKLWERRNDEEFSPLAVGQGGIGVFIANSYSESTSFKASVDNNGTSFEASYSKSQSSFSALIADIKA